MDGYYGYDPYRKPPAPPPGGSPPPPHYPPPYGNSASFASYPYPQPDATQPPPQYLAHSGSFAYPPNPYPPYNYPGYPPPPAAATYGGGPPPSVSPYGGSPPAPATPYDGSSPALSHSGSGSGSGSVRYGYNSGEPRFPHSEGYPGAYGADSCPPPPASLAPPSSASPPAPAAGAPPLDKLMSGMKLSDHPPPASDVSPPPPKPVLSPSQSAHYPTPPPYDQQHHRLHSASFSASSPPPPGTPYSAPVTPFSTPATPFSGSSPSAPGTPYFSTPATPFSGSSSFGSSPSCDGSYHGQSSQIVPYGQPSKASLRVLLLHGNLEVWVLWARNLPNMDMFHKRIGEMFGGVLMNSITGKLQGKAGTVTSDPYVTFSAAGAVLGRTYVKSNSENPDWNQHFYVPVAHQTSEIQFHVKDSDVVGSQLMGTVRIPAEQIYGGAKVDGVYPVLGSNGKPCRKGATLCISIQYIPIERLSMYHTGVDVGPDCFGVPGTYFPVRKGGNVRLYQDAHIPDGMLPDVWLEQGEKYAQGKCWYDICKAISEATRLIYITGWSVYHKVRLVRDAVSGNDRTLGDLLMEKSRLGVRVLLLVWDDPTSRSIVGYQSDGLMDTHDEETRRFFKHSSVEVLLCSRSSGKRHGWAKQQEAGLIYTHHQKSVIVDADAGNHRRKIIAFVGGLDLCKGRYDTPYHPLFKTLKTLHSDDYHNPNFTGKNVGGPREPWHDLHSRIDGPAAYDVLQNFQERWLRASRRSGLGGKLKKEDDKLLIVEKIPELVQLDESVSSNYANDNDPESWHVQIFRSIDSNSVKGFPKVPEEAIRKNLVCGKNILIDMSIHTAYVKAIRAAQHFIYIENQYFLGSSFNWSSHKDLGANNLIPMEIALKIANKIKSKERFSAYIVIPMWPEGAPTGAATQRILYWQNKTMQMMYEMVYEALVEAGLDNEYTPEDYLNFFCLGNRELPDGHYQLPRNPNEANTPSVLAQKNRRFMIYVHSKGMIVDDEYVILGSANINQRSLEGTRDTEIAMGAYQPNHTWARKPSGPRGQIHAYRMSLWAEHTGRLEDCFLCPESLECTRRLRQMGEHNWRQFASDDVTEMGGHLIKYPVDVDRKGKVKPLPRHETFPDTGGNICGSFGVVAIQENLTI